jgi:SanA protein
MLRRPILYLLRALSILVIAALLLIGLPNLAARSFANPRLYAPDDAPSAPVAIVFGAGLTRTGTPSAILRDRVETAAALYHAGKVEKLLMSGDNRFVDYNEPGAMREYALGLGVADEDIVLDFAGRRTYDTCYRARFIFGIDEALVVTQSFHITRAVYTCGHLGVKASGVPSDVRRYGRRSLSYWSLREMPATAVAVWEVWVARPLPVLGKPEPIFQSQSDDGSMTTRTLQDAAP